MIPKQKEKKNENKILKNPSILKPNLTTTQRKVQWKTNGEKSIVYRLVIQYSGVNDAKLTDLLPIFIWTRMPINIVFDFSIPAGCLAVFVFVFFFFPVFLFRRPLIRLQRWISFVRSPIPRNKTNKHRIHFDCNKCFKLTNMHWSFILRFSSINIAHEIKCPNVYM